MTVDFLAVGAWGVWGVALIGLGLAIAALVHSIRTRRRLPRSGQIMEWAEWTARIGEMEFLLTDLRDRQQKFMRRVTLSDARERGTTERINTQQAVEAASRILNMAPAAPAAAEVPDDDPPGPISPAKLKLYRSAKITPPQR